MLHTSKRAVASAMLTLALSASCAGHAAAAAATDAERAEELVTRLQTSMTAVEDSDRDAPRDRWDPAYIVQTVGIEPEALLAWIRANVTWEPYHGALRGPLGVLMDRKGNSLDQALLFAELLRRAGKPVRLAHADLSPASAAELWKSIAATQALPIESAPGPLPENAAAAAAESLAASPELVSTSETYGIDHSEVSASLKSAVTRGNALATALHRQAQDQGTRLLALAGLPDSAAGRKALEALTLAAIADHWWVQMRSGAGWIDADPIAPRLKLGAAAAPASSTADPDALPDAVKHTVTVRVVIEQWKEGRTSEHVPLEQSFDVRDLVGVQMELLHSPSVWPSNWPEITPDDVQIKLRAAVYSQSEWLPTLLVGKSHFSRASIKDIGEINEHPSAGNPFREMMVPAMGQIQKASDTLATLANPNATLPSDKESAKPGTPRPQGELVAEWLEFELNSPGGAPRKVRRQVFDLLGPALRGTAAVKDFTISLDQRMARATAELEQTEIMVLPCALSPEYLVHLLALNVLENKDVLNEVSRDPFSKVPANYVEIFSKFTSIPGALYAFASMRFDANPQSPNLFIDRPLVVLQHGGLSRGAGGDFFVHYALDIVDNGLGVDPRTRENPAELRLRQGVVDTNTEAAALRLTGQEVSINTADAFAAAQKGGNGWTVLKPGDEAKVGALQIPADPAALISADLKAGNIVVALSHPEAAQKATWWRIDPFTGLTLGVGPTGSGQAMVEYALVIIIQGIINTAQCMLAGAAREATETTLKNLSDNIDDSHGNPSAGIVKSIGQGAKAGYDQAAKSLKDNWKPGKKYHCFAMGMLGAFDAGLMIANFEMSKFLVRKMAGAGSVGNEPGTKDDVKPSEENKGDDAAKAAEKAAEKAQAEANEAKAEAEQARKQAEEAQNSAKEQERRDQDALKAADEKMQKAEEAAKRAEDAAKKELSEEQRQKQANENAYDQAQRDYNTARKKFEKAAEKNTSEPSEDNARAQREALDGLNKAGLDRQAAFRKMKGLPPADQVVSGDPSVDAAGKTLPGGEMPGGGKSLVPEGGSADVDTGAKTQVGSSNPSGQSVVAKGGDLSADTGGKTLPGGNSPGSGKSIVPEGGSADVDTAGKTQVGSSNPSGQAVVAKGGDLSVDTGGKTLPGGNNPGSGKSIVPEGGNANVDTGAKTQVGSSNPSGQSVVAKGGDARVDAGAKTQVGRSNPGSGKSVVPEGGNPDVDAGGKTLPGVAPVPKPPTTAIGLSEVESVLSAF